jgi:hypothetical protein
MPPQVQEATSTGHPAPVCPVGAAVHDETALSSVGLQVVALA